MAVGDEDVAVGRDGDIVGLIEGVRAVPGDPRFAERQQNFSVAAEFEYLVPYSFFSLAVGHPDVDILVDANSVGEDEHSTAEAHHKLAGRVELEDRRIGLAGASIGAASFADPDALAVAINFHGAGGSPGAAFGE